MDNKIKIYSFRIGQNNTTKKREIQKAKDEFFKSGVGGCEVVLSSGFWKGENKIYKENSYIISFMDLEKSFSLNRAIILKSQLKRILKQEEFLLCIREEILY
jgi:hypothetical protein